MELEGKGWMKEKNLILMQQGSISHKEGKRGWVLSSNFPRVHIEGPGFYPRLWVQLERVFLLRRRMKIRFFREDLFENVEGVGRSNIQTWFCGVSGKRRIRQVPSPSFLNLCSVFKC